MKRSLPTAIAALAALTLAACSGASESTSSPSDDPTGGDSTPQQETYEVRVAALPIAETGALWAAINAGIFEDHGIEVEIVPAQGGALAIPALLSGDIDFAIGQPFGTFRAAEQNLGVAIIGNYADSLDSGMDVNGVVTTADSGIEGPADLAGKRVSVNSLGAAGDVTIMKAVEDAGGDASTIEFVEVAFPDVPAQLEAGNIDAAWAPDPFMSQVVGAGGSIVVHPYQATVPGLSVLMNITSQANIDDNPEMVEAFAAAMTDALEWASENEDAVRSAIALNLEIPEEAAAGITLPTFTSEIDTADLEALAQIAGDFDVLGSMPDLSTLVQQP